jgi:polyphosphate kinase
LLATGNLNEGTARFYTDHILLTSNEDILGEVEQLFEVFSAGDSRKAPKTFNHLLVAQFNLLDRFLELIDREISAAKEGRPAGITIKLNNLEERVLINKLYEASNAGVRIRLLIRGICCLVPGVVGQSEHISVKRIVDRYLEHGRMFIFHNGGRPEIWLGSADWMTRNIYRRVEVCFPVYNERIKALLGAMVELQWADDVSGVYITEYEANKTAEHTHGLRSQEAIYHLVGKQNTYKVADSAEHGQERLLNESARVEVGP